MLADNIKKLRKQKGLSQEELAIKVGVVRQTISKWEQGNSVPDSEMLIRIAESLDTTVNTLLGEVVLPEDNVDNIFDFKVISSKLEVLNQQLAQKNERNRKVWRMIFLIIGVVAVIMLLSRAIDIIYYLAVMNDMNSDTSIIGGYDGPTSIYVSSGSIKIIGSILNIILAIVAGIGLYQTRRK